MMVAWLALTAHGADLTVCATGCDHSSIGAAIDAASSGDRVLVGPGDWDEDLTIGKDITVRSLAGSFDTFLRGQGNAQVVNMPAPGAVLQGFTIEPPSSGNDHRGILVTAPVTVRDISMWNHDSGMLPGAAIHVPNSANLVVESSRFGGTAASSESGGAISTNGGDLTVRGSEFVDNVGQGGGAIHAVGGDILLERSAFINGQAGFGVGGGIYYRGDVSPGTVVFDRVEAAGNVANQGADAFIYAATSWSVRDSAFAGGLPQALLASESPLTVERSAFFGPEAGLHAVNGSLAVTDSAFTSSAGLSAGAELDVSGSVFHSCTNNAVQAFGGNVELEGNAFIRNEGLRGGAIYAASTQGFTATANLFCENSALGATSRGGAIELDGGSSALIDNNGFARNTGDLAGAIYTNTLGSMTVQRNTFLRDWAPGGSSATHVLHTETSTFLEFNLFVKDDHSGGTVLQSAGVGFCTSQDNGFHVDGGINLFTGPSSSTRDADIDPQFSNPDGACEDLDFTPGNSAASGFGATSAIPDPLNAFLDDDEDGWFAVYDCDDGDASVHPFAPELCFDGIDSDCDRLVDALDEDAVDPATGAPPVQYPDTDHDGHGAPTDVDRPEERLGCDPMPGWSLTDDDCDDRDFRLYPDADDVWYDGIDSNCDGASDFDRDGDGDDRAGDGGTDCDDNEPTTNGHTVEVYYDGRDNDCDPSTRDDDQDGDGDGVDVDCDDENTAVGPSQPETPYNGVDDDCDVNTPDDDLDGDGFIGALDCNDDDDSVHPDAVEVPDDGIDNDCAGGDLSCVEEVPYDGIDQDCDGSDLTDVDGDGHDGLEGGGLDCDDSEATVNPDAAEVPYDGVDQDCDGQDVTDVDGDGHDGEAAGGDDCDDTDPEVHPDMAETWYDGTDQDCDGVDDDQDGDGFPVADDCVDTDPAIYPGAPEGGAVDVDCSQTIVSTVYGGSGCGCSAAPSLGGTLGVALAGLLVRRRR